ncbi:hypothetical protein EYF80_063119 [Liparis tanakae]|uniref:Notch NODP domain-containing protein n=1 Tax=Liparis tanakae TaxID=230148 RepID=A0A4Z2EDD0_9TELE|nr:hypothetical protein EYF80_063119 [Liparis tanakae]
MAAGRKPDLRVITSQSGKSLMQLVSTTFYRWGRPLQGDGGSRGIEDSRSRGSRSRGVEARGVEESRLEESRSRGVDNRPCSRLPSTCFPHATEAASFLRAAMRLRPASFPNLPELKAVVGIRGVREELGGREEETREEEVKGTGSQVL